MPLVESVAEELETHPHKRTKGARDERSTNSKIDWVHLTYGHHHVPLSVVELLTSIEMNAFDVHLEIYSVFL